MERKKFSSVMIKELENTNLTKDWDDLLFLRNAYFANPKPRNRNEGLALALLIVGAGRREAYLQAADMIRDWHELGGPFWVCVLELLRHHTFSLVDIFLLKNPFNFRSTFNILQNQIFLLLNRQYSWQDSHPVFLQKKNILVNELRVLFNRMANARQSAQVTRELEPTHIFFPSLTRDTVIRFNSWFCGWGNSILKSLRAEVELIPKLCDRDGKDLPPNISVGDESAPFSPDPNCSAHRESFWSRAIIVAEDMINSLS